MAVGAIKLTSSTTGGVAQPCNSSKPERRPIGKDRRKSWIIILSVLMFHAIGGAHPAQQAQNYTIRLGFFALPMAKLHIKRDYTGLMDKQV
jgi:hypothetical protein